MTECMIPTNDDQADMPSTDRRMFTRLIYENKSARTHTHTHACKDTVCYTQFVHMYMHICCMLSAYVYSMYMNTWCIYIYTHILYTYDKDDKQTRPGARA